MVNMRSYKYQKKQRSKKIFLETLLSLTLLFAVFLGAVSGYYGSKVLTFLDNISENTIENEPETLENTQQLKSLDPFSVLILGTDIEEDGIVRSDSIIVATINPTTESMKMVSIPRDTFVTLPNGRDEKINAAYATGGPFLAREMVSDYLDIPIDFYASLNFDGLVELVDAVDGVTVNSERAFTEGAEFIGKGRQELDGDAALAYARMRKKDPRGDFGRQDRQKEVIVGILEKLNSAQSIPRLTSILDSVSPYLKTNASSDQMIEIALNYHPALNSIEQLTLEGEGDSLYFPSYGKNLYIWRANDEALTQTSNQLKRHLGIQLYPLTTNSSDN